MLPAMLRIVADQDIVAAEAAFGPLGQLTLLPASAITPAMVAASDVLLVRSVTQVGEEFARLPNLRFVGTATIGTDHLDVAALRAAGIAVHHAPGSNADSVVEYVIAALLHLAASRGEALRGRVVGLVGCGSIGSRLACRLPALGCAALRNDPPLAAQAEREGRPHEYLPLAHVLEAADVVSLHVPYTRTGPNPTHHLVGAAELERLRTHAWLLNTARGAVVANAPLRSALEQGAIGAAVLDVWEHEPLLDRELMARAALATPHIAGHSFDGKLNGTTMLHDALVRAFELQSRWDAEAAAAPLAGDRLLLQLPAAPAADAVAETRWLHALVQQLYPIAADDYRTRGALAGLPAERVAAAFQALRREYPRRRAFNRHVLPTGRLPAPLAAAVREGLQVRLSAD